MCTDYLYFLFIYFYLAMKFYQRFQVTCVVPMYTKLMGLPTGVTKPVLGCTTLT